ncbi:MAG: carbohydrate ABC transporter permease [Bacillota bacterium]|nr:carbohydrate ABC transporter permease [Bacillota bacterium]
MALFKKNSMAIKQTAADRTFDIINVTLLTIVLLIVLYPLVYVISASISDPMLVLQGKVTLFPKRLTLSAYKMVFKDDSIMNGYKNTIFYTVLGTICNLIMTIMCAYPLSRKDLAARQQITFFISFTMFFSGGMVPTYLVIQKLGLLNNYWSLILPGLISVWNMLIMKNYFQSSIPYELQEAAKIDGCSNIGILIKLVMPLSVPIVAVMVMYYGVGHWNEYFNAMIYLNNEKLYPLQLVLRGILIQNDMSNMTNESSMVDQQLLAESIKYAVIIVSSIPVLMLYPLLQRYFVKGVMVGAIKG